MNHNHVSQAVGHLDAVTATREHLLGLYDEQRANRGKPHEQAIVIKIAEAHQAIGFGLKAAAIEADIAQARALERIADLLAVRPASKAVTL